MGNDLECKVVHGGEHVIAGQRLPAHGHHRHRGLPRVEDAGIGGAVVAARVGVLLLFLKKGNVIL